MNSAVDQAVNCIWERYSDPLSLDDMAQSAMLSHFHFARVFKEQTGVSPGRFLAAVRIYQAKRMLVISSMSVAGVSSAVGYGSLGSFTNHFTDSVGISPSRFRRASRHNGARDSDMSSRSAPMDFRVWRKPTACDLPRLPASWIWGCCTAPCSNIKWIWWPGIPPMD